jgi:hypothetical protein
MTAVNQWQHVAVTYKKTNTSESVTRLYINGVLKQTDNHTAAITYLPGATFFIGKTHDGGYFNGELDDIRIYKRAMTDAQVLAFYMDEAAGGPLPVTLLNLQVYKLNTTTAKLSWQTATELNNRGFQIQRSFDGINFTDVKFVNGAGNSDIIKQYSITDIPGKTGIIYYRLKQVDIDGNSKLSNTVIVSFNSQGIIKVYPNPAQQHVTIEGIDGYNRIQLIDITGKRLNDIILNKQYQININLDSYLNGLYFIMLMNEKETKTIKLTLSK